MTQLLQWTKESEDYEFIRDYKVHSYSEYEFISRQDDYYITLLNQLYILLDGIQEDNNYDSIKNELLALAHGMEIFSLDSTKDTFKDVDKNLNILYVASIYYMCDFSTISTLFLKNLDVEIFETKSAKIIYYILSGGKCENTDIAEIKILNAYILSGDENNLSCVRENIYKYYNDFHFKSLDDFFDTFILTHIINKYNVTNIWNDLKYIDCEIDWSQYVIHCYKQNVLSFLPSQRDPIKKGLLNFQNSFSLTMPTSAGKSYLTELVIFYELQTNPNAKILYLAPLRSLAYELKQRFKIVSKNLGFTYRSMYGGGSFNIDEHNCMEAQLLISTPEKFMSLEGTIEDLLDSFSLIICDEGQLLDSLQRGINYELLLSRLKKIGNKRYLFISAIIPNIEDINTWLGGTKEEISSSSYRPVDIKFAYSRFNSSNVSLGLYDASYNHTILNIPQFINSDDCNLSGCSQRKCSCAMALKSLNSGSVLVFTNNKNGTRGCIAFGDEILSLIQNSNLPSPINSSSCLNQLKDFVEYLSYQFGDTAKIVCYAKLGYIYHNADLPQDIREKIEYYYSKRVLSLVVCTSTLAEGVNFPVKTLILGNIQSQNKYDGYLLDRKSLKNIIGRVGRAGREKYGLIILPASSSNNGLRRVLETLKNVRIEEIKGTLYDVVNVLSKINRQLSDSEINSVLEEYEFSSAIDLMISRNGEGNLQEIDIDSVINSSLAYHLGDESTRCYLRKIFEVRHLLLCKEIGEAEYPKFKATGLSVNQFKYLEDILPSLDGVKIPSIYEVVPIQWVNYIIDIVYDAPFYSACEIGSGMNKIIVNKEILASVLIQWLQGRWYHHIANELSLSVEDVIVIIGHIRGKLHMCITSILRYMNSLEEGNSFISIWSDYVYYGIDNLTKYNLIKTGLSDRIGVNVISDLLIQRGYENCDHNKLRSAISTNLSDIKEYIEELHIPNISKSNVESYLNNNNMPFLL